MSAANHRATIRVLVQVRRKLLQPARSRVPSTSRSARRPRCSRGSRCRAGVGGRRRGRHGGQHGDERRGCSRCERHDFLVGGDAEPETSPRYTNPLVPPKVRGSPLRRRCQTLVIGAVTFPAGPSRAATGSDVAPRPPGRWHARREAGRSGIPAARPPRPRGHTRWPCGATRGGRGSRPPPRGASRAEAPSPARGRRGPAHAELGERQQLAREGAVERRHGADLDQSRAAGHRPARPSYHAPGGMARVAQGGLRELEAEPLSAREETVQEVAGKPASSSRAMTQSAPPGGAAASRAFRFSNFPRPPSALEPGCRRASCSVWVPSAPSAMLDVVAAAAQLGDGVRHAGSPVGSVDPDGHGPASRGASPNRGGESAEARAASRRPRRRRDRARSPHARRRLPSTIPLSPERTRSGSIIASRAQAAGPTRPTECAVSRSPFPQR